ncbi:hypothetical protein GCM10023186_18770 [Hymenobacter koreensis]|uniref:Uncharacterized protein n=1 Tax=Hymenobacter koreensis TaxID=1084523 RepID=A0ABP8IZA9_9BACT
MRKLVQAEQPNSEFARGRCLLYYRRSGIGRMVVDDNDFELIRSYWPCLLLQIGQQLGQMVSFVTGRDEHRNR